MAPEHTHRVVRRPHNRSATMAGGKPVTFAVGDAITPTDAELSAFGDRFEQIGVGEVPDEPDVDEDPDLDALTALDGIGEVTATQLYDAGYRDPASIREATTDELLEIEGLGPQTVAQIEGVASEGVDEEEDEDEEDADDEE